MSNVLFHRRSVDSSGIYRAGQTRTCRRHHRKSPTAKRPGSWRMCLDDYTQRQVGFICIWQDLGNSCVKRFVVLTAVNLIPLLKGILLLKTSHSHHIGAHFAQSRNNSHSMVRVADDRLLEVECQNNRIYL